MRNSIILPKDLESLLIYEAKKSGLIDSLYNFDDEFDYTIENEYFKRMLDNKCVDRQNLFRLLLLFDDIILSNATQDYDYSKLLKTGIFNIFYMEDAYESDPIHKDGHIQYATHLKPAILPAFENDIKSYFRFGQPIDGFTNFVSALYDGILLDKRIPSKYRDFIELNKILFDGRNIHNFKRLESDFGNVPKQLTTERFYTDISSLLCVLYESLCWQLEISSNENAAIINSEFKLANIGCEEYTEDISSSMEAFRILRVECSKIIGSLPKVDSIQEVFQLKKNRRSDIHNLKQELSRLEYEIRNGSSQNAIEKAAEDIEKASNALSKGNLVNRVTKWTNIFSIPISIASLFMGQPQIAIGSGIVSVVGKTSSLVETTVKDKNKWFEIIF